MLTDHLDDERIERLHDGELDDAAADADRAHLAACEACRVRFDQADQEEREVFELLRTLDHATPSHSAADIARLRRSLRLAWLRRAAVVAVALGVAGGAWAIPGSPLPGWTRTVIGHRTDRAATRSASPGVLMPAGGDIRIVFAPARAGDHVDVVLFDGPEIEVRTLSGRARFAFRSPGRLEIESSTTPVAFEIRIPRDAARVEVLAGERIILLKHGDRITSDTRPDPAGVYRLPLRLP